MTQLWLRLDINQMEVVEKEKKVRLQRFCEGCDYALELRNRAPNIATARMDNGSEFSIRLLGEKSQTRIVSRLALQLVHEVVECLRRKADHQKAPCMSAYQDHMELTCFFEKFSGQ